MQARAALATAPDGSDVFHVTLTKLDMDGQTSQMDFVNTTFIGVSVNTGLVKLIL